ncbi:protein FLX-like 3 [Miscanthus floridulus]|uniref:protein FLX-like 3 n=1 Tax=Miscanthus floridulus TaxID=154761 RepID=UPI0034576BF1
MAWQPWSNNGHRNSPSNSLAERVPGPMHLLPSQEELAVRCEEIRRIAADNTLVLEDILGLWQELAIICPAPNWGIKDEIHMLTKQTIPILHLNEMEYRDIIQGGSIQLEEQMRALKPIKAEVLLLSSEKMELEALRKELSVKVQSLYKELEQIRFENKQIPAIREGLHDIQEEILRARMAYEHEKRGKIELLEQSQAIERDFINKKMKAQRLRSELEKRRSGVFEHHAFGSYCNR